MNKLRFELVEDTYQPEQEKRWVVVRPSGDGSTSLLLARALTPHQEAFIGNPAGGPVFLFLQTDDFQPDYAALVAEEFKLVREPKQASHAIVAVFEDLYGNLWDFVQFTDHRATPHDASPHIPKASLACGSSELPTVLRNGRSGSR